MQETEASHSLPTENNSCKKCLYPIRKPIIEYLKPVLQLGLLAVFLFYFGLPAVERFRERKVLLVSSRRASGGILAPAITIMARNSQFEGWRNVEPPHSYDIIERKCSNKTIEKCIHDNTFNRSELVNDVLIGFDERKSLIATENLFSEDFTFPFVGRTYTLNNSLRLSPGRVHDQLFITFKHGKNYTIYIHDQHFFVPNDNHDGVPLITEKLYGDTDENYFYRLLLTEVEELDLPEVGGVCLKSYNY